MQALIVDNNHEDRESLKKILQSGGFAVHEAENGQQALARADRYPPDIIVSEVQLPVMDGYRLCRAIKSSEATCGVLFIFYTGTYADIKDEDFAFRLGADRFFLKTGNREAFLKEIQTALDEHLVAKVARKYGAGSLPAVRAVELEKYRAILESIEDGYYEADLKGNLVFFNRAMCEITGYPETELKGMNFRALMDAANADRTRQVFRTVFTSGQSSKGYDWKVSRKNGASRYLDTSVMLSRDGDGRITGFRGLARDVTDRRLMERFLDESEKRYGLIFESAPVGIFHYDNKGIIRSCNQVFADIGGSAIDRIIGFNLLARASDQRVRAAIQKTLDGMPDQFEGDYTSVTGGRTAYIKARFAPVFSEDDVLLGGLGVVDDFTDRRQMEQALRESEEKYRGLAERSPGLVLLSDAGGVCRFASPSAEQIFGVPKAEMLGAVPGDFFDFRETERILSAVSNVMKGQTVGPFETPFFRKDGSRAVVEWEAVPVREKGQITMAQFSGRDITARKMAEEALKKSQQQLRELSMHLLSSREQERAGIAREIHDDLGQSLTAIKLNACWLKNQIPGDRTQLIDRTEDAIRLVDSVIQTVKRISAELRPGLLDDLGLSAAVEWQAESYKKRSGIDIHVSVTPEEIILEEAFSIAIFRVFQEALTNVIRHSGATEAWVTLAKKTDAVSLAVTDNGVGITENALSKKESFGLIGMRERIHALGGEIRVFKMPAGGTRVSVHVPFSSGA